MSRLFDKQIQEKLALVPGWTLTGIEIHRTYGFSKYADGVAFANRAAALAAKLDHHPDILIQYDKVTLTLTSHDAGGLTERDFRYAQTIDG